MSPVGKQYASKFNYFDSITLLHRKTRIIWYQPTADGVYYTNTKIVFSYNRIHKGKRIFKNAPHRLLKYTGLLRTDACLTGKYYSSLLIEIFQKKQLNNG